MLKLGSVKSASGNGTVGVMSVQPTPQHQPQQLPVSLTVTLPRRVVKGWDGGQGGRCRFSVLKNYLTPWFLRIA